MKTKAILIYLILFGFATSICTAEYSGGNGEPNNPYRISTAADMQQIGAEPNDWDKHFVLTDDINLAQFTGTQFNIIGTDYENPFTGIFDGNGFTISNFTYESNDVNYIGLFVWVDDPNAEIKNLTLINPNINVGKSRVIGSLVGGLRYGTICDCSVQGGTISLGVGYHYSPGGVVGGLVGGSGGLISNCYAATTISGNYSYSVGGLIGDNYWGSSIFNCYAASTVSGNYSYSVGGLIGINLGGSIWECYATGTVSGDIYTGGLVGRNEDGGTILICYADSTVDGNHGTGGLVGVNSETISNCSATGTVLGTKYTGGLVGINGGRVSNCYATTSVSGDYKTGGLVGINEGLVFSSYAAGLITSDEPNTGGLVGYSSPYASYTMCFWDSNINPDINGIGNLTDPNVMGESTENMQTESTFTSAGWDFIKTWDIHKNKTYPFLRAYPDGLMYSGGSGEANDPYRISTAVDIECIRATPNHWNRPFVLTDDIILPDHYNYIGSYFHMYVTGIGDSFTHFTGVFDGNGFAISNFNLSYSQGLFSNIIGFFGYVGPNAEVKNLGLIDPNLSWCRGSLVGYLENGTVTNCYIEGGTLIEVFGGMVGDNDNGTISNCHVNGLRLISHAFNYYGVGGLIGTNRGYVTNCSVAGEISGRVLGYYGGLVGKNDDNGVIIDCFSTATVNTIKSFYEIGAGGLVGWNDGKLISNCYAIGTVIGDNCTGGLVGINESGPIENCYAAGTVTSDDPNTGGLIGCNYNQENFYSICFWDSDINPGLNGIGNTTDPNVIGETTENMQTESTFTSVGWDFVGETVNGANDIWKMCYDPDYPHLFWEQCPKPSLEVPMHFTPRTLNPKSKGKWIKAHFILPEGFSVEDVNTNSPAKIVEPFTADSNYMDVFLNEDGLVKIMAAFDRADFCSNGSGHGDIVVIAQLTTGQYFYGTDTIRIKTNNLEYLAVLTSYWLEAGCGEPDWCGGADLNRDSVVDFIDFAFFDGCCLEFIKN